MVGLRQRLEYGGGGGGGGHAVLDPERGPTRLLHLGPRGYEASTNVSGRYRSKLIAGLLLHGPLNQAARSISPAAPMPPPTHMVMTA